MRYAHVHNSSLGLAYSAALDMALCMMEATSIMTIFCFTSMMSSQVRYTVAPILRAMEMMYLRREGRTRRSNGTGVGAGV